MYFLRKAQIDMTRASVSSVIAKCQTCQSIDPAPVQWVKGSLSVGEAWQRVGMDLTHYCGGGGGGGERTISYAY